MKKYYEIQVSNIDECSLPEVVDMVEKLRAMQFPGTFWGWVGAKLMVTGYQKMIDLCKKEWDKKILKDPSKLAEMPKFPGFHLMNVYEDYDKIMREKK